MSKLLEDIKTYVEEHIGDFHAKRLKSIDGLQLAKILKKKNPYLYKAKNVTNLDIVKIITDAHVSSNEETIFGDWLEGLALFIATKVYGARKSLAKGVDIEFDLLGKRYIIAVKSGPNWGNSSQIAKMKADFTSAKRTLQTSGYGGQVEPINGCCYGRDDKPSKGDYQKLCGQRFWHLISGHDNLYIDIIVPLGNKALEHNIQFQESYNKALERLNAHFIKEFCKNDGSINWALIVELNSKAKVSESPPGKQKPLSKRARKK